MSFTGPISFTGYAFMSDYGEALAQLIACFAGLVTGPRRTEFGSRESQFLITAFLILYLGI
jgi:hypothetical protein